MMSAETADPAAATATAVPSAKLRNVCMVIVLNLLAYQPAPAPGGRRARALRSRSA